MTKLSKEDASSNYNRCYSKWEELDKKYQEMTKQYISLGTLTNGQPIPTPKTLTIEALRELDRIAKELNKASKQLYKSHH